MFCVYTEEREFHHDDPEAVFDWLNSQVGTEEAIEASSWCELACVGEEYESDNFYITVEEG